LSKLSQSLASSPPLTLSIPVDCFIFFRLLWSLLMLCSCGCHLFHPLCYSVSWHCCCCCQNCHHRQLIVASCLACCCSCLLILCLPLFAIVHHHLPFAIVCGHLPSVCHPHCWAVCYCRCNLRCHASKVAGFPALHISFHWLIVTCVHNIYVCVFIIVCHWPKTVNLLFFCKSYQGTGGSTLIPL